MCLLRVEWDTYRVSDLVKCMEFWDMIPSSAVLGAELNGLEGNEV